MLAVFQHYGASVKEWDELRRRLVGTGITARVFPNSIVKRTLEGSKFDAMRGLFQGPTVVFYSAEDRIAVLSQTVQGLSKFSLLGVKLNDAFLNIDDVARYATMPPLERIREDLVATVGMPAAALARALGQTPQALAAALEAHSKSRDDNKKDEAPNSQETKPAA
eukprot:Opistho-2@75685